MPTPDQPPVPTLPLTPAERQALQRAVRALLCYVAQANAHEVRHGLRAGDVLLKALEQQGLRIAPRGPKARPVPPPVKKVLRAALAQAWPDTRFLLGVSPDGGTAVYYLARAAAPSAAAVTDLSTTYAPGVYVAPVATTGAAHGRRDGQVHVAAVYPVSVRHALLR